MNKITVAVLCKFVVLLVLLYAVPSIELSPKIWVALILDLLLSFALLVVMRIIMIVAYNFVRERYGRKKIGERIFIYGTGDKSVSMITRLAVSTHYKVAGFLKYNSKLKNYHISEYPVFSFKDLDSIKRVKENYRIDGVLFAIENDAREEQERLIKYCTECRLKVLIAPTIDEVVDGKLMKQNIREIKIEDLLSRDEIKISIKEIQENFISKVVMVTGAAGSIGSELCRQLASFGVKQLVLFDNAETPMHNIRLELEERFPKLNFIPVIGDVRLLPRLDYAFRKWRPQVVFHAAAYKHVPLMEENPCEAVLVNVVGSRNVADKCIEYDVEKMVMVSTDKAVNPTNIMGCTKRLAEIYVQALGLAIEQGKHNGRTKFVTTRFGNVLGSNGSVIPRFREQIAKGGPITVTHPEITRFFMTIPEACRLVMEAATMSTGNQIFVFDMGASVKIAYLAKRMIELAGLVPGKDIEIAYTGLRPGEKLYEEVLSSTENTIPTDHNRIRIAKVREYDYNDALKVANDLEKLSRTVEIPDMVRLMKKTVPEFISKNSQFEVFDKES
ncbi:polysaccharide biosynthesis protein [Odoribacter laneus]|jgi:predicted nucleoside-diphosphate sugar epimerases|nr:nucleoside-diphosphate sugar epimerase/dehydratase [Odoribacter laneus]